MIYIKSTIRYILSMACAIVVLGLMNNSFGFLTKSYIWFIVVVGLIVYLLLTFADNKKNKR